MQHEFKQANKQTEEWNLNWEPNTALIIQLKLSIYKYIYIKIEREREREMPDWRRRRWGGLVGGRTGDDGQCCWCFSIVDWRKLRVSLTAKSKLVLLLMDIVIRASYSNNCCCCCNVGNSSNSHGNSTFSLLLSLTEILGVVLELHTLLALQIANMRTLRTGLVCWIMDDPHDATVAPPFSGLGSGLLFKTKRN